MNYKNSSARGFTLIELLVVIAIIGILSAVILAALGIARAKGVDASIKSDLNTVQTQAVLDYNSYPEAYTAPSTIVTPSATPITSYPIGTGTAGTAGVDPFDAGSAGDATAQAALNQAATESGAVSGGGIQYGYSSTAYVVQAALTEGSSLYWCIDSTGAAVQETAPLSTSATSC